MSVAAAHQVDDTFEAAARTADDTDGPLTMKVAGVTVRVVDTPAMGALVMFARRVDDKNPARKIAAAVRLLEKWVVPEDHDALWEAIEDLDDIEAFMEGDVARFVETVAARPT